jgi:inorganic pyrophosphatase
MDDRSDTLWSPRLGPVPGVIRVVIEVPRGGFIKRRSDGSFDFISPLPCPYNYGSLIGTRASDGEPVDALVLGPPLRHGDEVEVTVRAAIGFVDAGVFDPKVICADHPLTRQERRKVARFFRRYALFKRGINALRTEPGSMGGRTVSTGWLPLETARRPY